MAAKGFRKIDNQYFEALMSADLTRSGYKVLFVVINFTLGYQRDRSDISLSTFQKLTKLSRPAVKTAVRDLIAYGLISQVGSATNRLSAIYKLNEDWRGEVDLPSGGIAGLPSEVSGVVSASEKGKENLPSETSGTYPPDVQNLSSRGQVPTPATMPLKKERKLLKKTNNDHFGTEMVALSNELKGVISYYFKAYREHKGEPHPDLKVEQWQRVVADLEAFCDEYGVSDFQDFQTIIDYHFQRKLKTDYNINHFATHGILENLYYKKLWN